MLLCLNAVVRDCEPCATAASVALQCSNQDGTCDTAWSCTKHPLLLCYSVRTVMDSAQEALEEARAKTAREELRQVTGAPSADQQMLANVAEKEQAEDERRPKWAKPASKGGKGQSQDGWYQGSWGSGSKQWPHEAKSSWTRQRRDLMSHMVRAMLRHEAEIQRLKQDLGYMVFIDTSGLGCLSVLHQVAENWQEQYTKGTVTSPLRLVMFMALLETLRATRPRRRLRMARSSSQRCQRWRATKLSIPSGFTIPGIRRRRSKWWRQTSH